MTEISVFATRQRPVWVNRWSIGGFFRKEYVTAPSSGKEGAVLRLA